MSSMAKYYFICDTQSGKCVITSIGQNEEEAKEKIGKFASGVEQVVGLLKVQKYRTRLAE